MHFISMMSNLRKRHEVPAASSNIEAAEFGLIVVHWKGSPCIVKVRELSDIQIQGIGNFSLIETNQYQWSKAPKVKIPWGDYLAYANKTTNICKVSLVSPTYDEIFALVGQSEMKTKIDSEIKEINESLHKMAPGPAKQELEGIRDSLIMAWDIVLPDDFRAEIVEYALKVRKTDIKKVTGEMLYNAAILADRGHGKPHEYIHGVFSDFNVRDIDTQAWIIFNDKMEELRKDWKMHHKGK